VPTIFRDKVTAVPTGQAGVTFNDALTQPVTALRWGIDVLPGWKNSAEADPKFAPIGIVDGEIPGDFFPLKGRVITIGGYVEATSRAEAELLEDVILRDAFPRNTDIVLTRFEPVPKFVTGRRFGVAEIEYNEPHSFRWAVQVKCGDPLKYAVTSVSASAGVAGQSSGGRAYPRTYPLSYTTILSGASDSATVVNSGRSNTKPIIDIHGPLVSAGGWHLANLTTGGDIKFNVAIASASDHLVIDFASGTAELNGVPVTATIYGDFWPVVPGANTIKLFGDYDPAAGFSVTINSAWE
jgi:hypothetical protein